MKYDYIIIDDIYCSEPIELVIGRDVEKFDVRSDEIVMTLEQLSNIIVNAVKTERSRKESHEKEA